VRDSLEWSELAQDSRGGATEDEIRGGMLGGFGEARDDENSVDQAGSIAKSGIQGLVSGIKSHWQSFLALKFEEGERIFAAGEEFRNCHMINVCLSKPPVKV
jgi:hypothetical protein